MKVLKIIQYISLGIFSFSFPAIFLGLPDRRGQYLPREIYGFFIDHAHIFGTVTLLSAICIVLLEIVLRKKPREKPEIIRPVLELFLCVFLYSIIFEALLNIAHLNWLWEIIHLPSSLVGHFIPYHGVHVFSILVIRCLADLLLFSAMITLAFYRRSIVLQEVNNSKR